MSPAPGILFFKMMNNQDFSAKDYSKRSLPASKASMTLMQGQERSPVKVNIFANATPVKDGVVFQKATENKDRHSLTASDDFMPLKMQKKNGDCPKPTVANQVIDREPELKLDETIYLSAKDDQENV
jgi:hypothetical protein